MNSVSMRALDALRSFPAAKQSVWHRLPFTRRAAVLVILYGNKYGDLNSILTMRSSDMTSFAGHAALPGGKVDTVDESELTAARRETFEEIGIPADDEVLSQHGYSMEHLTTLPAYLSRNFLAVRPCIVHLYPTAPAGYSDRDHITDLPAILGITQTQSPEVKEVFSAPLEHFLSNRTGWYSGKQVNWGGLGWNQHWFKTLRRNKSVGENGWLSVWGLTANILIDTARIAYGREPDMPHRKPNSFGDEELLQALLDKGKMTAERARGEDVNFEELFGKDNELLLSRRAH
ncbi:peroxisomal coenzyme A diphosphatase 1, peroxisomal [Trichomonascus vanleenenianus]|uniref:8-oxo-dGTP diphosphatase n=1 Tax=Trichomonascus vanleenenianus TaxID=2268995 RepID=UPI003ECAE21C